VIGGSTEILVRETLRGAASEGAETAYIFLNELDIMPCQACGQSPDDGYCFFNDGMDIIYEKFDRCDAIVVGSPIYFDSVSAQTKLFIDRCNCFRAYRSESEEIVPRIEKRRKGAIVLVGGEREEYEHARRVIGGFFVWANIESTGVITYAHGSWNKGSVKDNLKILKTAFHNGVRLVGQ
jgi:multimeric flavodoxin WrbA